MDDIYDWKEDNLRPKTGIRKIEYESGPVRQKYKDSLDLLD